MIRSVPAAAASLSNIAAPGADRQERVLGGGVGADPLVAGDLVVGVGKCASSMAGAPGLVRRCRAASIGPPSSSAQITISSVPS
nr:hypothetical protein [Mycobacterium attenuatum]